MRSISFHFAIRSERENEPTLNWPASQPTARWAMVTSSLSPERAETMVPKPAALPASRAALVSVTVPAWFGLMQHGGAAILPPPPPRPVRRRSPEDRRRSPGSGRRPPR